MNRTELIRSGAIVPRFLEMPTKLPVHPNQQPRALSRVNAILARRASFKGQK